jgi:hypothetical protein
MEPKTATALGVGIVTVITPLVFPAIPLVLGIGFYSVAGGLFLYAGRHKLVAALQGKTSDDRAISSVQAREIPSSQMPAEYDPVHGPVELTEYLARRLIAQPISPKTLRLLTFIASQDKPEFALTDAVDAVPGAKDYLALRGAWAGLTRRTRSILNDSEAYLVQWRETYDRCGEHLEWLGRVSPMTHLSLRKALKVSPRDQTRP